MCGMFNLKTVCTVLLVTTTYVLNHCERMKNSAVLLSFKCNPAFDCNVVCNGRAALSVFSLTPQAEEEANPCCLLKILIRAW